MSTLPRQTPSSSYTLDGKGGSDTTRPQDGKTGKPTTNTGPTYVYYRLYTKLGAIESNHPIYSNDGYIGRIPSKSFAPPRTVASIKRHICQREGLSDPDKSLIFAPLSSPTTKEDSARLSLHAPSGPGLSEQDPIALVVDSEKRSTSLALSETLPERSDDNADICYIHYRVYSSEGDRDSKTSFDESDSSLGRINTLFVAPPYTAGSLKACIAKTEGLVTPNHTLCKDVELFEDLESDAAMNDTNVLSFLGDTYPGSNGFNPLALVNATTNESVNQEHASMPPSQFSANNKIQTAADSTSSDMTFTKRARLTSTYGYTEWKPIWLSLTRGEIVRTDGILVSRTTPHPSNYAFPGYLVINSAGEKGFVMDHNLVFI